MNGKPVDGAVIRHEDIMKGGTLVFVGGSAKYNYVVDSSAAPELDQWLRTKMVPAVRKWYPKLVEMFPSDGWEATKTITFNFNAGEDSPPAYTVGNVVTFGRKWIKGNPGDVGCGIHELFHVVQDDYPDEKTFWLQEGIADYVRWYLYEPESHGCDMDLSSDDVHYDGAYRESANFLDFVERRYPGTVRELNALCRQGNNCLVYFNGENVGSKNDAQASTLSNTRPIILGGGGVGGTSRVFPGSIDEVRISTVARSADWVKASHDTVSDGCETTDIQWVQDSAYRFFPLVEDELLGVTLHPFDLATNKLLALAGRRVPRDWVDTISCSQSLQPLGFLAWAANGKDLGLSPRYILEMAARTRYVQSELDMAVVSDEPLDVAMLSRTWHEMIEAARQTIAILPPDQAGKAVLNKDGSLFTGSDAELSAALAAGEVVFHEGRICGAWPQIVG